MTLSKLRVVLEATTGQFNRAMKAVGGVFKRTGAAARGLGAQLLSLKTAFSAMLAVFAFRRLAEVTKSIFDLGAAVSETQSKFSTTFGAASNQVQGFLDQFANMAGLSRVVAQDLTSTTGAIIQGLGFTQQASADLSEQVVRMAGDFASFNNIDTAETLNAVTTALVGEREQMKRLGVVLLEADVQQRALLETGKANARQLTQQDKTLASLSLIYEKAGVQMGDLTRTQDSAANKAKQLGATWTDLRNIASLILLPALIGIMEGMANNELGIISFNNRLRENGRALAAWTAVAVRAFTTVARATLLPAIAMKNMAEVMIESFRLMRAGFLGNEEAMEAARAGIIKNLDDILQSFKNVGTSAVEFARLWREARVAFGELGGAAGGAGVQIEFVMGAAIEQVERLDAALVNFALDFSDRIGRATTEGAAAFDGFVTRVLQGLARIAAEMAVFQGLKRLFPNSGFISAFGSLLGIASGGKAATPALATAGAAPANVKAGGGVVFNQQVIFNIAALDGASVAAVLKKQEGTIALIVAEAAQKSTAFKRALR